MFAFFKGLLLAFAIAFGVGPGLILQFDASINRGFFYGAVVVIGQSGALIMDLTKCYVFHKVKHFFRPSVLIWINRISGSALVATGIYIILKLTVYR